MANREELLQQKEKIEKQLHELDVKDLFWGKYKNPYDALEDEDWLIRLEGYRVLGFTKKAFDDEYWLIRLEAKQYFKIQEWKKENKNGIII